MSRLRSAVTGLFVRKVGADPRETVAETDRDRPLLVAIWESAFEEHSGCCKFCDSCPHTDGSISHGEDCPVPRLEKRLGR
jgi:hypothetical protein